MRKELSEKSFLSDDSSVRTLAACMNRIFRKVDEEGLSEQSLEELATDINCVASRFQVDNESAVLLSAILEKSETCRQMGDEELARFLGCTNIEFIRYHERLRGMNRTGIILSSTMRGQRSYQFTPEALKVVEMDSDFTPLKVEDLTADTLFSQMRRLFADYQHNALDADNLIIELDLLIQENNHLLFCRKAAESTLYDGCSDTERRMFFFLCTRYVCFGNGFVPVDILMNFSNYMDNDSVLRRRIACETLTLQTTGLVCFANNDGFVDNDALSLTDAIKESFFQEVTLYPEEPVRHRDLVSADSIPEKNLFYNPREKAQIDRLKGLLEDANFRAIQERLVSSGMRKGFNAIFYGAPGTGKTASAYELARRTGRDIFCVDMTKLKSKWVGDSEKSVRGVFQMYRSMCRTSAKAPILFFNEADAIFSKRLNNVEQSVDQMNNAIQNIILEEMESIEGILIATTNLLSNLDPAFERRFIFKVEFSLPGKDSRAKIWKSMVPGLQEGDADVLAGKYAFSGGNIENIARKCTVEYVLSGNLPTLASLTAFCDEELLGRKDEGRKIGF